MDDMGPSRIRLYSMPNPAGRKPIGFNDEATARRVLESIRAAMVEGKTLERALAPFRGRSAPEVLVEPSCAY